MYIIQTVLREMPSSLLAELGSYRYGVYVRDEGWSIPTRICTLGQEYDRFDRSDVIWIIAWHKQHGICGCARLFTWQKFLQQPASDKGDKSALPPAKPVWEMSRFSARLDIDTALPLNILWHSLQAAKQAGVRSLYSAVTPMLEKMYTEQKIFYQPLPAGVIQSEDSLFAVSMPIHQPHLAKTFGTVPCYSLADMLPAFARAPGSIKT